MGKFERENSSEESGSHTCKSLPSGIYQVPTVNTGEKSLMLLSVGGEKESF